MTLLIACILIYEFKLPWWFYLVALVVWILVGIYDDSQIRILAGGVDSVSKSQGGKFDELDQQFTSLATKASDLAERFDNLERQLTLLAGKTSDIAQEIGGRIDEVARQLASIKSEVANAAQSHDNRLGAVESEVSGISDRLLSLLNQGEDPFPGV